MDLIIPLVVRFSYSDMKPMSQSCTFCRSSKSPGRNNSLISALHTIECYALDSKGVVGSLYDVWTNNVLSNLSMKNDLFLQKDIKDPPVCHLIKINNPCCDNLLKLIGIDGELRVSIALDMVQVTEGTLLLYTYELPTDRTIRFISYFHVDQEKYLSEDIQVAKNTLPRSLPTTSATHIITSVKRGIDFVIVLELPNNEKLDEMDAALNKLCTYFREPESKFLKLEDQLRINDLKPTIFTQTAGIHSCIQNKNLSDICQDIHRYIYESRKNAPLSYTLHPIKCIYPDNSFNDRIIFRLDSSIIQKIEQKMLPLSKKLKRIQHSFYNNLLSQLSHYFKIHSEEIRKNVSQAKDLYIEVQHRLASKLTEFYRDKQNLSSLETELNGSQINLLDSVLENLYVRLVALQSKADFIAKLRKDYRMYYVNLADFEDIDDDEEDLQQKLFSLNQYQNKYYLCSSDKLMMENSEQHKKLCQKLVKLCQTNSSLYPAFADFSYCSYKLNAMTIFQPPVPFTIKPNEINILLVGETGVGKSTFINAFVNYLAFCSLEDAETSEPVVLIPVSFLITIGDQFQEHRIEFGQSDLNEDHNHSGQSVTQHCKSYILNIGQNVKLRMIDTPGIGDTRGVDQDDKNIEHILSYTSNLPHLNAICFLMKPNTTRLHALFRSCFSQLFDFLGPNARDNIIFCFTNTRTTFYTPGSTATLLREMLQKLPTDRVPRFTKENTFCFDSESFRYLTIIKAGHESSIFNNQKQDFERSWKMSVGESVRLLRCIECRPKYQMNTWHSIKHAQMMITLLVRPILETMRNALRNLVLGDVKDKKCTIEMEAQPVLQSRSLCAECPRDIVQIGEIWIVGNSIQDDRTSAGFTTCHCVPDKHLPVLYELKYRLGSTKSIRFHSEIEKMKDQLLLKSIIMTQFLLHTAHVPQNPFLPWFNLLDQEEKHIYLKEQSSIFHVKLYKNMHNLKTKYEKILIETKFDQKQIELDAIYQCINDVLSYPIISEQLTATRESQMEIMKDYEHDVSSQYPHMSMNGLLRY